MATQLILIIGAILLFCGSAGLFIVRLTNPRLRGLGWLGGSFASGSAGAFLLFEHQHTSVWLSVILADVLVLAGFVLLHVAILDLTEDESPFPILGIVLLVLQAIADLCLIDFYGANRLHTLEVGFFVAVQAVQTAVVLLRAPWRAMRAPVWFSATLLICLLIFNLGCSIAVASGVLNDPSFFYEVKIVTYVVYIAVALGMAFGFFWMTATILTARLEQMASTDPLTRVYNRRVFLEWCEKERTRSQRTGAPFSILMIDLDHFKQINDRFGHRSGDEVLCAAVEKMQDSIRGIDILGRWGGEEFTVLLPGASAEAALLVAHRIRGNIEQIRLQDINARMEKEAQDTPVTASMGLAAFRGGDEDIAGILQRADSALYDAKAAGRNRILVTS
jgi:diguanylate cyclase (GGDEF)-like protein